ncbi:hypothetical protein [Tsukamurella sp. PLM1]|uniref:hypothetical protein n=1 Tax=Tsukamurella sp. PLM1 TaxID=2929795 RepID=UPI0021127129|nr:hypothetical protein [Tsukamurella sp. PLM1]
MIAARPCFPARLAHGSRRAAIGVLAVGMLLVYLITLALTSAFPGRLRGTVEILVWALRSTSASPCPARSTCCSTVTPGRCGCTRSRG